MLVYFAHPIDQASVAETVGYRSVARQLAKVFGWVFDPSRAFLADPELDFDKRVQRINNEAIALADAVFAMLPAAGNTIGTVAEVIRAAHLGHPVMVYSPKMPIGLGDLPPNVELWQADPLPGKRNADLEAAARRLLEVTETINLMYPAQELHQAKGTSFLSEGPQTLHYSGPLHAARRYNGDAAWDVPSEYNVILEPGERRRVKTGVYVAPPPDVWISMVGRSSMFGRGLFVEPGVIDSGWRGELEAKVYNLSSTEAIIKAGERIAQLIPHRVEAQRLVPVDVGEPANLPDGDRGTNGWGSTGS